MNEFWKINVAEYFVDLYKKLFKGANLITGLKTSHSYRFFNLKVFGMRLVRTFQSLVKLKRYVVLLLEQKKIDIT